jgi:hypothetical protein
MQTEYHDKHCNVNNWDEKFWVPEENKKRPTEFVGLWKMNYVLFSIDTGDDFSKYIYLDLHVKCRQVF